MVERAVGVMRCAAAAAVADSDSAMRAVREERERGEKRDGERGQKQTAAIFVFSS